MKITKQQLPPTFTIEGLTDRQRELIISACSQRETYWDDIATRAKTLLVLADANAVAKEFRDIIRELREATL